MNDAYAALGRRACKGPSQCVKPFAMSSFSGLPFFVVAGPIIDADKQLIPVEEHLGEAC